MIRRQIEVALRQFHNKMIFIYGPRQSGKTFIVMKTLKPDLTLNMDIAQDRAAFKDFPRFILQWYEREHGPLPALHARDSAKKPIVFLDEIHKVRGWRDLMKGTYDVTSHAIRYVASGSSAFKLRVQEKGDSLAGRAVWLELPPVTFREYVASIAPQIPLPHPWEPGHPIVEMIRSLRAHQKPLRKAWMIYNRYGGFPENLVAEDDVSYRQWLKDYTESLLDRDLKDLAAARDVDRIHQIFRLLLQGVGTTYSLRSLAQTMQVAVETVKGDIGAIHQVLWGFDVPVSSLGRVRQIRKEKKFYPADHCFLDYLAPLAAGARLETAVACLLHRSRAAPALGFYRDYSQREVDFVVRVGREIPLAIEVKTTPGPNHLGYFSRTCHPQEALLIVEEEGVFEKRDDSFVVSVEWIAPL